MRVKMLSVVVTTAMLSMTLAMTMTVTTAMPMAMTMPKLNSRDGLIREISSMVSTAPPRYPSALAVLSHPAWA